MRAIVLGNITLDETFALPALPRPGETLLGEARGRDLGGKGANQAVLLGRAGIPTRLVARIGRDAAAETLRQALAAEPVENGLIDTDLPTDRSLILLAPDGENCIVSTAACARALSESDAVAALAGAQPGDLLLLQGNLTVPVTEAALRAARAHGMRTVLNPAPVDPGFAALWPLLDLAVVNAVEAADLTGAATPEAALHLIRAAGAAHAVVTLGADGAIMDAGLRVPAAPAEVRDTTGAGDTFTAVLAATLFGHQLRPEDALRVAAQAAAITVGWEGTLAAFPDRDTLCALIRKEGQGLRPWTPLGPQAPDPLD
ncbi:MAG TPA: ribokinase [Acetobacteraceae bacterium]|nr:ribokinase [Acetobacteraceae bacterium]